MLTIKIFNDGFKKFQLVFEFQPDPEYQAMVYSFLKDKLTDKRFLDTCNNLLKETTKDDWNKAYGFKGRPAVKDWIDAFIPKAIEKTRYVKCKITGANLKEIYFDYPDDYLAELNQNKQGKLEAESSFNKNNRLPQLEAIKTNLIKKI